MVDITQFGARTARFRDELNKDFKDAAKKGEYGRAAGTAVRGAVGMPISALGETLGFGLDATLNDAVFPLVEKAGQGFDYVADGIKGFGRGLFGIKDAPKTAAKPNAVTPLAASSDASNNVGGLKGFQKAQDVQGQQQAVMASQSSAAQPRGLSFDEQLAAFHKSGELAAARQQGGQNNAPLVGGLPSMAKPELRQEQRPFVATFGDGKVKLSDEQRKLLDAALTPHKGAQNGQLTANQLGLARQVLQGNEQNALDLEKARMQQNAALANAAMNNDAALQREWLQQNAGLHRQALGDAAADARSQQQLAQSQQQFDARQALDSERLGLDKERIQTELNAAQQEYAAQARVGGLREALANAKDDETRTELARQLAILSGQGDGQPKVGGFNKDAFMKLSRNVVGADGLPTSQDDVIDLRTGKSILNSELPSVQVGQVVDGMRFKGGNPRDEKNWEKA